MLAARSGRRRRRSAPVRRERHRDRHRHVHRGLRYRRARAGLLGCPLADRGIQDRRRRCRADLHVPDGTTTSTSDTSRVALTSPFAQTGVADTGTIDAYMVIRTFSSTGVVAAGYNLTHALAATGLAVQPAYGQSGVSSGFDT
jgi:hypothetical protein